MSRKLLYRSVALVCLVLLIGCSNQPPKPMLTPRNLPTDTAKINPWIAQFIGCNTEQAQKLLGGRFESGYAELDPLEVRMQEYIPLQIIYEADAGYVRCFREQPNGLTENQPIFVAEPLPDDEIVARASYFDKALQPLMKAFLERYSGSGEEVGENAGQFAYRYCLTASEYGLRIKDSDSEWNDAMLFYAAMNGDSVLIRPDGSTAWHALETGNVVPIAKTFTEFIRLYADFRGTDQVFDSWNYREFLNAKTR